MNEIMSYKEFRDRREAGESYDSLVNAAPKRSTASPAAGVDAVSGAAPGLGSRSGLLSLDDFRRLRESGESYESICKRFPAITPTVGAYTPESYASTMMGNPAGDNRVSATVSNWRDKLAEGVRSGTKSALDWMREEAERQREAAKPNEVGSVSYEPFVPDPSMSAMEQQMAYEKWYDALPYAAKLQVARENVDKTEDAYQRASGNTALSGWLGLLGNGAAMGQAALTGVYLPVDMQQQLAEQNQAYAATALSGRGDKPVMEAYREREQAQADLQYVETTQRWLDDLQNIGGGNQSTLLEVTQENLEAALAAGNTAEAERLQGLLDTYNEQYAAVLRADEINGWTTAWETAHPGGGEEAYAEAVRENEETLQAWTDGLNGKYVTMERSEARDRVAEEYREEIREGGSLSREMLAQYRAAHNGNDPTDIEAAIEWYLQTDEIRAEIDRVVDGMHLDIEGTAVHGGTTTEEWQELVQNRMRAQAVLQYAEQHRYDDVQKQADFQVRSGEGQEAFEASDNPWNDSTIEANRQYLAAEAARLGYDEAGIEEYVAENLAGIHEFDEHYRDPDERWTDEERNIFYYLYATDPERAAQYGASVNKRYNAAAFEERTEGWQEFATRNALTGIGSTIAGIGGHLLGGLPDTLRMGYEILAHGDAYSSQYMGWSRYGDVAIGSIAQDLNERYGTIKTDIPVLRTLFNGKGLGDAYQVFTSMAESAASIALGGEVGSLAMFFGSAASSTLSDCLSQGMDPEKALITSLAAGTAEVLFEKVSVENLLSNRGLMDFWESGVARTVLKQAGVEASEEFCTELANEFTDRWINGGQSEFENHRAAYIAQGMSPDEASKAAWIDVGYKLMDASLSGALSGAGMSAGQYASYAIPAHMSTYEGNAQELIDAAALSDAGSLTHRTGEQARADYEAQGSISRFTGEKLQALLDEHFRTSDVQRGMGYILDFFRNLKNSSEANTANTAAQTERSGPVVGHGYGTSAQPSLEGSGPVVGRSHGESASPEPEVRAPVAGRTSGEGASPDSEERGPVAGRSYGLGASPITEESGPAVGRGYGAGTKPSAEEVSDSGSWTPSDRSEEEQGQETASAPEAAQEETAAAQSLINKAEAGKADTANAEQKSEAKQALETVQAIADFASGKSDTLPEGVKDMTRDEAEGQIVELAGKLGVKTDTRESADEFLKRATERVTTYTESLHNMVETAEKAEQEQKKQRDEIIGRALSRAFGTETELTEGEKKALSDAFLSGPEMKLSQYATGVRTAYRAGISGVSLEEALSAAGDRRGLSAAQFRTAWELGARKAGMEVSASDLQSAVSLFGAQAGEVEAAYQAGQDVSDYVAGMNKLVQAVASTGRNAQDIIKAAGANDVMRTLTPEQISLAQRIGDERGSERRGKVRNQTEKRAEQRRTAEKISAPQERAGRVVVEKKAGRVGAFQYEGVDESKLSGKQQVIVEATKMIAEATGLEIRVIKATGRMGGAYQGNGVIYLNIASGMNLARFSKAIAAGSLSHEMTHWLQEYAPEQYEELRNYIVGAMSAEELDRLVRQQQAAQPGLSYDGAIDEIVANACQPLLRDTKAIQELALEHRTLAEKIRDFIKSFAEKIRAAFADVNFRDNLPIYQAVQAVEKNLGEIQGLWDAALREAATNMQAEAAVRNASEEELSEIEEDEALPFQTWDEMTDAERVAEAEREDNAPAVAESRTAYQIWTDDPPVNTQYGFKLMNVDENGLPHAMFIDAARPYELGQWYTADSPKMENLLSLETGYAYLVDENDVADIDSRRPVQKVKGSFRGLPGKAAVNQATAEGKRWMVVDQYADGSKSIHNVGINGSGGVSTFALRPGIHAVDIPSMKHIGSKSEGSKKIDTRRADQAWFLIEYPVDMDYNQEAYSHETRDIREHLPEKGWYSFQTNSGAEARQHWFITGGMKVVGMVSEADARRYAREHGFEEDLPWKQGKNYEEAKYAIDLDEYIRTTKAMPTPSKEEMRQKIEAERNNGVQMQTWEETGADAEEKRMNYDNLPADAFYRDGRIYDYDFLVAQDDMIVAKMPWIDVQEGGASRRETAIDAGIKNAAKVGSKVSDTISTVKNNYTKRAIQVSKGGIEHGLGVRSGKALLTNIRIGAIAGEVIQNGIPINGLANRKTSAQIAGTYALATLLSDVNEKNEVKYYVAISTIEQVRQNLESIETIDVTHAFSGRMKRDGRASLKEPGSTPVAPISTISIADLLEIVNDTHKSILSDDVLEHFGEERPTDGYYSGQTLFQLIDEVEETDKLVAVHNKSVSGLKRMLERGGVPFPSIAIKKAGASHEGFGDVSIVFPRSTIDPEVNRQNRLYSNDAWTPTEPRTEYEVVDTWKLRQQMEEELGTDAFRATQLGSYLEENQLARDLETSEGDIVRALKGRTGIKYAYLKSIGQEPEAARKEKPLDGFGRYKNAQLLAVFETIPAAELKAMNYDSTETLQKVADVLQQQFMDSLPSDVAKRFAERRAIYTADKINPQIIKDALQNYEASGGVMESEIDDAELNRVLRDNEAIEEDPQYQEWIRNRFGNLIKDSGIPNGKGIYTDTGNRRSFKARHVPATLENIVAQMRKEQETGIGLGGINLRGAATKAYSSVEEMRRESGKLLGKHIFDEEYDSYMKEFGQRLNDLTEAATKTGYDVAKQTLLEAVRDSKNKIDMKRRLQNERRWIRYSDELTDELWQLKQDVQNMPAPYFEAKPRRIVYPEEALAYILPDNADKSVLKALQDRGYNVMTYEAGNEQDRLAKLNSVEGAQFQIIGEDVDDNAAEARGREVANARIQNENMLVDETVKGLQEIVKRQKTTIEKLMAKMQRTTTPEVRESDAKKLARDLISQYGSEANAGSVAEKLKAVGDMLLQSEKLDSAEIKNAARAAAQEILSQSYTDTNPERETYQEIARWIRSAKLVVSREDMGELNGGFSEFHKRTFGRINVASRENVAGKSGYQEIDSFYGELATQFAGYIPPASQFNNPGEMLQELEEIVQMAQPEKAQTYGLYMAEATENLANQIVMDALNGVMRQTAPTMADRQQTKTEALRDEIKTLQKENRIAEREAGSLYRTIYDLTLLLDRADSRYTSLAKESEIRMAEIRENSKARIEELKAKHLADTTKLKAHFLQMQKNATERRNESAGVKKYRKQIEKKAKALYELLATNSDEKHVPEVLKAPLSEFLQSIDFTSRRALAGGPETQADRKFGARLLRLGQILENQQRALEGDGEMKQDLGGYIDISDDNLEYLRNISEMITQALTENRDFTINQMSAEDLKHLSELLSNLGTAIRGMNQFMANARYETIREAADRDITNMELLGKAGTLENGTAVRFLGWEEGVPYYVFRRFGAGGESIFEGLTRGWEKMAMNAQEIIGFTEKTYTDKEVREWKREIREFELEDGRKIRMTVGQIMALSQLLGRAQALQHIERGGVRIGDIESRKGRISDAEHYHLTEDDIIKIVGSLSERQLKVAQEMRHYMATRGAEWGNEVSMRRFGYNFYGEEGETYFPIQTDSNDRPMADTDAQKNSMFRLLNLSASKSLNPKASNALIVNDIFDVFSDHMADMAKLNGMGLPILDAIKWFSYKQRINIDEEAGSYTTRTLQGAMENAFGSQALRWFKTLMRDINGQTESGDRGTNLFTKFLGNYKAAAVAANLRVALLQPTSYVRALTVLKPQYLAAALGMRSGYREAMRWSGTAVWKSLGYYDTDISKSMRAQIQHDDSLRDKIVEKSMYFAELGDKMTWGRLWNACKLQARAENKGLRGDDLMRATADLFREVVYSSQVMDATLTRSEIMRGKSAMSKMSSAFMAEPTLSYNILLDAASSLMMDRRRYGRAAWGRNAGKIGKAFTVYTASAAFAALVESLADAIRDDDDDEFWQKWIEAFWGRNGKFLEGNLAQDMGLVGKLPFFKDLLSIIQGYASNNMSVSAFVTALDAYRIWEETYKLSTGELEKATKVTSYGNMTNWGKVYKTLQALSQLSGIAVSNVSRDAVAIWNTSMQIAGHEERKILRYESNTDRSYGEFVRGTGVSRSQYDSILEHGTKQDELGATLEEMLGAGKLTEEQAKAIWDSRGWKKSYADWKTGAEETAGKQSALEETLRKGGVSSQQYQEAITEADANGNSRVTQAELGEYLSAGIQAGTFTQAQAEAIWKAQGWKMSFDKWHGDASEAAAAAEEKSRRIAATGLSEERYESVMSEANTDGKGNAPNQGELGEYLLAGIRSGTFTERQAEQIWNSMGWKTSFAKWRK